MGVGDASGGLGRWMWSSTWAWARGCTSASTGRAAPTVNWPRTGMPATGPGGHARSGDRVAMAAFLGDDDAFDRAIAALAANYADVNEADHARLVEAIECGRVPAVPGI